MRTTYRVIVPLGVACVLLTLCMYAAPHWASVILAAATFIGLAIFLVVSVALGFARWRKSSGFWMMPALVCLTFMLIAWFTPGGGRLLADRQFKKHLSEYEEVISEIRNTENFRTAELDVIRTKHRTDKVRAIKAARCSDGTMVVAFLLNTNVPLLHEGYVYKGYKDSDTCIKESARIENNWPYVRPVTGNWYHFSDQPGL